MLNSVNNMAIFPKIESSIVPAGKHTKPKFHTVIKLNGTLYYLDPVNNQNILLAGKVLKDGDIAIMNKDGWLFSQEEFDQFTKVPK